MDNKSLEKNVVNIKKLIYIANVNEMIYKRKEMLIHNNRDKIQFLDYIFYQLTTYTISLLNNRLYVLNATVGTSFMCRCIIETLALLKMYEDKHITDEDLHLIPFYSFLVEGKIYGKYKELDGKLFYLSSIQENYDRTVHIYKKYNREVTKYSKFEWLKNFENFNKLVEMYCESEYKTYQLLSVLIHPNDHQYSKLFNNCIDIDKYIDLVFESCSKYFPEKEVEYLLKAETFMSRIQSDKFTNIIHTSRNIVDVLESISDDFKEVYGENIQSSIYTNIARLLNECYVDIATGFDISVTCKIKPLIEAISLLYYLLQVFDGGLTHKLNWDYTVHYINNLTSTNFFDVKKEYKKYDDELSEKEYRKFLNGKFSVHKGGSINKIVKKCFEEVIPKITDDKSIVDIMKLGYEELQNLSHANCYMLQSASNVKEFGKTNLIYCINILIYCMRIHVSEFKTYMRIDGEIDYTKVIANSENNIKLFIELVNEMVEIIK